VTVSILAINKKEYREYHGDDTEIAFKVFLLTTYLCFFDAAAAADALITTGAISRHRFVRESIGLIPFVYHRQTLWTLRRQTMIAVRGASSVWSAVADNEKKFSNVIVRVL
jgi:hypothetical protein